MGWRDTQAKIESGALNYNRPARSNSDYFFEAATSSFSDAFRSKQAEKAEDKRYARNRADKLKDEERTDARALARENETARKNRLEAALERAREEEKVTRTRRTNAAKLLRENGRDATNPNFMQFAMDHLQAYGDSYSDAEDKFTELNKRITEVGPMQGPLLRRSDVDLDVSMESTGNAYRDATRRDDNEAAGQIGNTVDDLSKLGGEDGLRGGMEKQMDAILGPKGDPATVSGVREALRSGESGGNTEAVDFNKEDGKDHVGLYQFGQARLDDYNNANNTSHTVADLKAMSEEEQEAIADWHFADIETFIDDNGLDKFVGQTVGGVNITRSGLIAMAHLGGNGGMKKFLETDGEYNPDDSSSTVKGNSLAQYAEKFGTSEATTTRSDGLGEGELPVEEYATFEIDPPKAGSNFEFGTLKKDTYLGVAEDYRRKGDTTLADEIVEFGNKAFGKDAPTKLTDGDYARLYASYSRMRSSNDPAEKAKAELWFKEEEPALREGLGAAKAIGDKPSETVYYITTNGKRILAREGDNGTYVPIDPTDGESILKSNVTQVETEDSLELIKDSLNAVSTQTKGQRNSLNAATTVAIEGYDLVQMAKENELVLTLVGGAGSAIGGVRQEVEALFNVLGETAQSNMDQETVLGKMYEYIDGTQGISDDEAVAAYKNFSAAMVRYVFAAGKALGQEGNGFSNQDYNNIKSAMFAGKGIEGFEENLQTFARQRMAEASRSAKQLAASGQISFAVENGAVFGSDLWTAKEYFENTSVEGDPDYYGWANSLQDTGVDSSAQNILDMEQGKFNRLILKAQKEDGTFDYSAYSEEEKAAITERLLEMKQGDE